MQRPFHKQHIDLLIDAFKKDPMFVKLFKGEKKDRQMRAFFKFVYLRNRYMNGLYITDSNDEPSYVAFVEKPFEITRINIINKLRIQFEMLRLTFFIPFKSLRLLSKYEAITAKHRPKDTHYYLTMIAVCRNMQGQGLGKKVIEQIHSMVSKDSKVSSICLDTENIKNVSYYEKLGYELVCEEQLEEVSIYCMKKPLYRKLV